MKAHSAGFTLLEVLVALSILGFLLTMLVTGTRFGLSALRSQTEAAAARESMETTERILRALLAQAEPGDNSEPAGLIGTADTLILRTRLPTAADLVIDRAAEAALGMDARHRLILRVSPLPRSVRLSQAPVLEEMLIDGIDHIELAYWQGPANGQAGHWVSGWRRKTLPPLLRLRIVFPPADRRVWPDFVAALPRDPVSDPF